MDYTELVKSLRICSDWGTEVRFPGEPSECDGCSYYDAEKDECKSWDVLRRKEHLLLDAADATEELLKAARAMHLWIFLNTGDEEKVYEECGLSDEMNAALGYGGKMVFRSDPPKEESYGV